MRNDSSKQILLSVLGVAILVVAVVGVSFAAFTYTGKGSVENTIKTGTIKVVYNEGEQGINITNAMPVSDEVGKTIEAEDAKGSGSLAEGGNTGVFDFNVEATIVGTVNIKYDVIAIKQSSSDLEEQYAKLYLEKSSSGAFSDKTEATPPTAFNALDDVSSASTTAGQGAGSNAKLLTTGTFTTTKTDYYRLRMWVADNYKVEDNGKAFTVKVDVYADVQ